MPWHPRVAAGPVLARVPLGSTSPILARGPRRSRGSGHCFTLATSGRSHQLEELRELSCVCVYVCVFVSE